MTIIDPEMISKYSGRDEIVNRIKYLAMDRNNIHEFATETQVISKGVVIFLDYTWLGHMIEGSDVGHGVNTRAVVSAILPMIQKVVTGAHELLTHSYRKNKGLPYYHGEEGVNLDSLEIEDLAKNNFNSFKEQWRYGKEEFEKHARMATEIGIISNPKSRKRREQIFKINLELFRNSSENFYDFNVNQWNKYWMKHNEKK